MKDRAESIFLIVMLGLGVIMVGIMLTAANDLGDILEHNLQHAEDFDLGSVVTTTAEYEFLTNDSFTGVVVRGEGQCDPAITMRNRDGVERRIATEFLEPME